MPDFESMAKLPATPKSTASACDNRAFEDELRETILVDGFATWLLSPLDAQQIFSLSIHDFGRVALPITLPWSAPQVRNGKLNAINNARASASVFAVVVMVMSIPRIASILSYSISGKIICSLMPML